MKIEFGTSRMNRKSLSCIDWMTIRDSNENRKTRGLFKLFLVKCIYHGKIAFKQLSKMYCNRRKRGQITLLEIST